MGLKCWIFGHERSWPTLPGSDTKCTFMSFEQKNPGTGQSRIRNIHMCERCGLLYWEALKPVEWKTGDPEHDIGILAQANEMDTKDKPPVTVVELRAGALT